MPLLPGKKNMGRNIAELEHAGHKPSQAIAIAYKEAGEDSKNSKSLRSSDDNGWIEIKSNPISKVGVFPYSGAQIDNKGEFGLEPHKIYWVYRPAEELSKKETIDSFKLIPWIDSHVMLGDGDGLMPANEKGVDGVIGEEVYFEDPYLKANIKAFAEKKLIKNEKKELSVAYHCDYDRQSGIFDGKPYEFIQRNLRGNHMASVKEGRAGHDVAVLDEMKFTIDTMEGTHMTEITAPHENETLDKQSDEAMKPSGSDAEPTMREVMDTLKGMRETMDKFMSKDGEYSEPEIGMDGKKSEGEKSEGMAADTEEPKKKMESVGEKSARTNEGATSKGELKKPGSGMDENTLYKSFARQAKQTAELANKLSHHIGSFAFDEMTLDECAKYGAKKLKEKIGLDYKQGRELETINGFLAGAKVNAPSAFSTAFAMDSASDGSNSIDKFLQGVK